MGKIEFLKIKEWTIEFGHLTMIPNPVNKLALALDNQGSVFTKLLRHTLAIILIVFCADNRREIKEILFNLNVRDDCEFRLSL